MYRRRDADVVVCPLCDVPHRAAATHCDSCAQPLHEPADLETLRRELSVCKRNVALGGAGVLAMVGLNVLIGRWAGVMLFYAPVLVWLLKSAARYRAVSRWVARCTALEASGEQR